MPMKLFMAILLLSIPFTAYATCSPEDAPYELKNTDRAYEQAMKLKAFLEHQGVEVACVLPSKDVGMFRNQLGAAFYRTSIGQLNVMILPESMDFQIRVVETRKDGRFLYTFEGKPDVDTTPWDAAYKIFFVQHRNFMFTASDEKLAEKTRSLVQTM
jgi:hypothetical protein